MENDRKFDIIGIYDNDKLMFDINLWEIVGVKSEIVDREVKRNLINSILDSIIIRTKCPFCGTSRTFAIYESGNEEIRVWCLNYECKSRAFKVNMSKEFNKGEVIWELGGENKESYFNINDLEGI